MSQDPLGFAAGDANFYRYVANNPLSAVDPDGRIAILEKLAKIEVQLGITAACTVAETIFSGKANDWTAWATNVATVGAPIAISSVFGSSLGMSIVTKSITLGALGSTLGAMSMGVSFLRTYSAYADWQGGNGNVGLFVTRFACTGLQLGVSAAQFRDIFTKVQGNTIQVTSWAGPNVSPDLNSGRWIIIGDKSWLNFLKTGLPFGKIGGKFPFYTWQPSNVSFDNAVTDFVDISRLTWPKGIEAIKALLNQWVLF